MPDESLPKPQPQNKKPSIAAGLFDETGGWYSDRIDE